MTQSWGSSGMPGSSQGIGCSEYLCYNLLTRVVSGEGDRSAAFVVAIAERLHMLIPSTEPLRELGACAMAGDVRLVHSGYRRLLHCVSASLPRWLLGSSHYSRGCTA